MENEIEDIITQSTIIRSNPKYLPEGRHTMRFGGITRNKMETAQGVPYHVVRVHFFIDTTFHGRRKFYKQYRPDETAPLHHDLRHYLDRLYPSTTKSLKKRIVLINKLKGRYADVRLASDAPCPRFGIVSRVTEFHGCGYFRYQEFMASQQDIDSGTLSH